jgi:RNA polymerase-binding transcription factor DksA
MEHDDGRSTITALVPREGNRRHRIARMLAVGQRLRWGGWKCQHCGEPVPLFKRADARFCAERCRKADARQRRKWRGA